LALAILELDPEAQGLLCLEEPENGIHPERIPAMLELLQDIATDVNEPIGPDNPLRQVIINTHSPAVVGEVPDNSLLVVESKEMVRSEQRFKRAQFSCLPDTWRQTASEGVSNVPLGKLIAYLNPVTSVDMETTVDEGRAFKKSRVVDRNDIQPLLPLFSELK